MVGVLNTDDSSGSQIFSIGSGSGPSDRHNAFTLWNDGSFAYNDDNFQNDNPGTEQNMFYFNYGNHDGLGIAQTKRAIRMGSVGNPGLGCCYEGWDINSAHVGNSSIAIGFADANNDATSAIASGDFSIALGSISTAIGRRSLALSGGYSEGEDSVAIGMGSASYGTNSSTLGVGARSFSAQEIALGSFNTSYIPVAINGWIASDRLLTIGNGSNINSDAFTILKNGNTAIGIDNWEANPDASSTLLKVAGSTYFGQGNLVYTANQETKMYFDPVAQSFRAGSVCSDIWDPSSGSVGARSIALGFAYDGCAAEGPTASGINSVAIGRSTIASGQDSFAIGMNTHATGLQSFAFGQSNTASGQGASTFGAANTASGDGAIAFGYGTLSSGINATAFGSQSTASGRETTSFGRDTHAYSWIETAIGYQNTSYTPTGTGFNQWTGTDRLLVVGNGNGGASDAFTILKNGKTGVGYDNFETTALTALLQVNGSIQQTGATSCSLSADTDGIIICTPSDENLKTNIENLTYGLDTITGLRPVSYTFKDVKYGTGNQIGFIAQELEQIIPEVVTNGPNYKSVNYGLLSSVIVKSIQEINLKITDINNIDTPNTWRDALIGWFENATNGIRKLFVGEVHTDTLCIGQTCVTESQLQQLLQNNQQVITPVSSGNPPVDPDPIVTPDDTTVSPDNTEPIVDSNPVTNTGSNTTDSGDTPAE